MISLKIFDISFDDTSTVVKSSASTMTIHNFVHAHSFKFTFLLDLELYQLVYSKIEIYHVLF